MSNKEELEQKLFDDNLSALASFMYKVMIASVIVYIFINFISEDITITVLDAFVNDSTKGNFNFNSVFEVREAILESGKYWLSFFYYIFILFIVYFTFSVMGFIPMMFLSFKGLNWKLEYVTDSYRDKVRNPLLRFFWYYMIFAYGLELFGFLLILIGVFDFIVLPKGIPVFVIILFFLPTMIALHRDHKNKLAIILTNLLLGITVIGWIGALIWSVLNQDKNS